LIEPATLVVVVVDAPDPRAAKRTVLALRKDDRVFDGDARLVVVAVAHPRADRVLRELAAVHREVKRVLVVVARRADRAEAFFEAAHASTSMPSIAISQPISSTHARSSEPSRRIGFELLMCVRILRPNFIEASAATLSFTGWCAMSSARAVPSFCETSSS